MEYVYPAVFHTNDDGSYTIIYPDLPGCISEGKSLGNALYMAQKALTQWVEYLISERRLLPKASKINDIQTTDADFVNLIRAEIKDDKAVKHTISIPKWMDDKVSEAGLSLSSVLQDALIERLPRE